MVGKLDVMGEMVVRGLFLAWPRLLTWHCTLWWRISRQSCRRPVSITPHLHYRKRMKNLDKINRVVPNHDRHVSLVPHNALNFIINIIAE